MSEGEPQNSQKDALSTGSRVFGRYQIVRCISSGGMGAVYEVVHLETRRRCALKVMLPSIVSNPDLRARFQLEATVTADIQSEHIVELFDAGVDGESGTPFIVMELLRGEDLQSMVFRRGALPPAEVTLLLFQAAMALDRTHAAGIVHRDLKPENLFVTARDDGSPRLKIFDFGIAKVVATSAHLSKSTQGMGTPMYMAPEQRGGDGSIGPPADTYALGHIAYALLVGEPYWEEEAESAPTVYAFLMKMAGGIAEPPGARARRRRDRALPPAFDAWLMKATAQRPEDRFQRATELVTELASALDQPAPTAASAPITIAVQPPSRVDVSPHADTIATDPGGLSATPAISSSGASSPDVSGRPSKPSPTPTPTPTRERAEAPAKRRSAGLLAAAVGVAVGLVIAIAGAWLFVKKPEPTGVAPKERAATGAASIALTAPSPTATIVVEAPQATTSPAVTPATAAPSTSADTRGASASTPASRTSASAAPKPTEKTSTGKPPGKPNTPPVDPLDVR